jgi:hypothetical protein
VEHADRRRRSRSSAERRDAQLADRITCIREIGKVYRALLVVRCSERLGHLSEQEGSLEMTCYMFWDIADEVFYYLVPLRAG